jgi:hypothetical protein
MNGMVKGGALLLCSLAALAEAPLFGRVTGVAADDRLQVRLRPDYRAPAIGALPPGARVGVERCVRRGRSRWCRIRQLTQLLYWEGEEAGWVNARYLRGENRGYVLVDGLAECRYSLGCREGICRVVGPEGERGPLAIPRRRLRGESRFGAAPATAEGYCVTDRQWSGGDGPGDPQRGKNIR